jgi:hypothetical protein
MTSGTSRISENSRNFPCNVAAKNMDPSIEGSGKHLAIRQARVLISANLIVCLGAGFHWQHQGAQYVAQQCLHMKRRFKVEVAGFV